MNTTLVKSNTVLVTTWYGFSQCLKEVHQYLDRLETKGEKLRLAVDTETYLSAEARQFYIDEKRASIKSKKKQETLTDEEVASVTEFPVPKPWMGKNGEVELRVRLIQIGLSPKFCDLQYVIDLDKLLAQPHDGFAMANVCTIFDKYEYLGDYLEPLFNRAWIVGQNLKYEYGIFWNLFKFRMNKMRDTFLMSQILNMGDKISHKLSDLYMHYIEEELFTTLSGMTFDEYAIFKAKEQKSQWYGELDEKQIQYAADDVRLIWYVFEELLVRFEDWADKHGSGIYQIVEMECELIKAIAKAEIRGFPFDTNYYYKEVEPYLQSKLDQAQAEVDKRAMKRKVIKRSKGTKKNKEIWEEVINQPYKLAYYEDIRELLGPELGSERNLEKTGADDLMFIRDKHWAVEWIIQYKKAQKMMGYFKNGVSAYMKMLDYNDVIHHTIHQIGHDENTIDTGRMSGSKPNLMQVPAQGTLFGEIKTKKLVKKAFAAKRGYKLVIYDYSQIEPRFTADVSQDEFLMGCFRDGRDMHAETARSIFLLDYLPLKDTPNEHWRDKGKIMRLARTYMMGINKFLKEVYVDTDGELDYILRGEEGKKEALTILENLDAMTPGVTAKREEIGTDVKELPAQCKSLAPFRNGNPFYVAKSIMGRTRRCCLLPEERRDASRDPQSWGMNERVLYEKTGNVSTWANKFNSKLRTSIREIFNNLIQSSCADIFKMSIVEINAKLEKLHDEGVVDEYRNGLINFVHDEQIAVCEDKHVEIFKQVMHDTMKSVGELYIVNVPVVVEGGSGISWLEAK